MEQKEKNKALNEAENSFNNVKENGKLRFKKPNINLVEAVDSVKQSAEKAGEVVGDSAKVAVEFAGDQLQNAKRFFNKLNEDFSENKYQKDKEKYRPIFLEDIESGDFIYPEMISVVDFDKRMDVEACKNAIGYREKVNGIDIVGIYKDEIDKFPGIILYPKTSVSVYYVDPLDKNRYIKMSEYFTYLKEARVAELKEIARSLGAKHFKVSIMEERMSEISKKDNAHAKLGITKEKVGIQAKKENTEKTYELIGVASESYYDGKEPERPELRFWKNSETIKGLVDQRLATDSRLKYETFKLDYNISTGITEDEAVKIDGALKALKFEGAGSISIKAKEESRRQFEYLIEF